MTLTESTAWPASRVSDCRGVHFGLLKQAIQEGWTYGGRPIPVAPFLLTGGTDSKHYAPISRHGILRFVPYALSKSGGDLGRIHSANERVHASHYRAAQCSYGRMLELFGALGEQQA